MCLSQTRSVIHLQPFEAGIRWSDSKFKIFKSPDVLVFPLKRNEFSVLKNLTQTVYGQKMHVQLIIQTKIQILII